MPSSVSKAQKTRLERFVFLNRRRDGGVPKELLDNFRVHTLAEEHVAVGIHSDGSAVSNLQTFRSLGFTPNAAEH